MFGALESLDAIQVCRRIHRKNRESRYAVDIGRKWFGMSWWGGNDSRQVAEGSSKLSG